MTTKELLLHSNADESYSRRRTALASRKQEERGEAMSLAALFHVFCSVGWLRKELILVTRNAACVILCFLFALSMAAAHAQTFACLETIDADVARADLVFVGTILSLDGKLSNDPYGHGWTGACMRVKSALKGHPDSEIQVELSIGWAWREPQAIEATLKRWKNEKAALLVVVESDKDGARWPPLGAVTEVADTRQEAWSADFQLLRGGEAILGAARAESERLAKTGPVHVVCIDKPKQDFAGTALADSMTRGLHVPTDERLEKRAKAVLTGELPLVYGDDSKMMAIEALGLMPTAENRALLQALEKNGNDRIRSLAAGALEEYKAEPVTQKP